MPKKAQYKPWENDIIATKYGKVPITEIMRQIDRSSCSIRNQASRLRKTIDIEVSTKLAVDPLDEFLKTLDRHNFIDPPAVRLARAEAWL